jgi:hypothetical protein
VGKENYWRREMADIEQVSPESGPIPNPAATPKKLLSVEQVERLTQAGVISLVLTGAGICGSAIAFGCNVYENMSIKVEYSNKITSQKLEEALVKLRNSDEIQRISSIYTLEQILNSLSPTPKTQISKAQD